MALRTLYTTALFIGSVLSLAAATSVAQNAPASRPPEQDKGLLVLMTGTAELEVDNDEAATSFFYEAQDADLAKAQSQVNRRVAEGVAALKRADPKATVETGGYATYPVYSKTTARSVVGWRVRQTVTLRTSELGLLPKIVAAGQQFLALGGLDFRLSRGAREKAETELIWRAIANLKVRVEAAAQAFGISSTRIRFEEINFGARGGEGPPIVAFQRMQTAAAETVAEPSFDPGRSTQQLTATARVRFPAP